MNISITDLIGVMVVFIIADGVKSIIHRIKRRRKKQKHTEFQKNSEKEVE